VIGQLSVQAGKRIPGPGPGYGLGAGEHTRNSAMGRLLLLGLSQRARWAASHLNHWPGQNKEKTQFKFYFISEAILNEFCKA
jgi:hypothetical protein